MIRPTKFIREEAQSNLLSTKTLFDLSFKEIIELYSKRIFFATMFVLLPISYNYIGLKLTISILFYTMFDIIARVISNRLFKNYLSGGKKPVRKDYIMIRLTIILSPIISILLLIALVPGFIISICAYPVVSASNFANWLRHPFNRHILK